MDNDPLAEHDPRNCQRCEGTRWVPVKQAYAIHLFPDPGHGQLAGLDDQQTQAVHDAIAARRRSALDSVYPCRECAPEMFVRWAGGHFKSGHNASACGECLELSGRKPSRRGHQATARPVTLPPEPVPALQRRDTDD